MRPTVRKLLEQPGGGSAAGVRATLRLVAGLGGLDGYGYATGVDIAASHSVLADSTGLIEFPNVRPNSGTSDDAITRPAGTAYELVVIFHDGRRLTEYIDVPDSAGPLWVQDYLTTEPGDLPPPSAATQSQLTVALATKASLSGDTFTGPVSGTSFAGTSLSLGSLPTNLGDIRMSSLFQLRAKSAVDSSDILVVSTTAGDDIVIGGSNANSRTDVLLKTGYQSGGTAGDVGVDLGGTPGVDQGVFCTNGWSRFGSLTGGSPVEMIHVFGNIALQGSGASSYARFITTTGKNWRVGTGFNNTNEFEIQNTSDLAFSPLRIDTTGLVKLFAGLTVSTGTTRVGQVFGTAEIACVSLRTGTGTDNGTTTFQIHNGRPRWFTATTQATVGAAGAASALPATPEKYFQVEDNAGTSYVIPVYKAS